METSYQQIQKPLFVLGYVSEVGLLGHIASMLSVSLDAAKLHSKVAKAKLKKKKKSVYSFFSGKSQIQRIAELLLN